MKKEEIIRLIDQHHKDFIDFIKKLRPEDLEYHTNDKWSAKQQLQHIILCVSPLIRVFGMDEKLIEQTFGSVSRPNQSYDELKEEYIDKLQRGGKAPKIYVPVNNTENQLEMLMQSLTALVRTLCVQIENFSESQLESLVVPHPILKNITLKEMLFNMIYHVQHHHKQALETIRRT